ncbi:MAG: hypothetical protein RR198_07260 [Oscillospiraceae bacterium]
MRSDTKIILEMFDTESKQQSLPDCTQSQSDVLSLKNEKIDGSSYATTEKDCFLLDGRFKIPQSLPNGLYSDTLSDGNGDFAVPVVLAVTFTSAIDSSGITLYFPFEDYPKQVHIEWYTGTQLLNQGIFFPDSATYFCALNVSGYDKLVLTFAGTACPQHYLKLLGIDYGQAIVFNDDKIIKSSVSQEIDLLCDEISINTLEFSIEDKEGVFSATSENSVFFACQTNQHIEAYSKNDYIGRFYLTQVSQSGVTAKFEAQDMVGLLDTETFIGGYFDTTVEAFCRQLLMGHRYTIQDSIKQYEVKGYLIATTKREALQQVCFALGLVADTTGSDGIKIYTLQESPTQLITSADMFVGGKVDNLKAYRQLNLTSHSFTQDGQDSQTVHSYALSNKGQGEMSVADAYFVNTGNANDVAKRIKNYYNNKVIYKLSMPARSNLRVGDMLMVYLKSGYIKGNIYQMNVNLSGGLTASVSIHGYITPLTSKAYSGEFYAGERGIC